MLASRSRRMASGLNIQSPFCSGTSEHTEVVAESSLIFSAEQVSIAGRSLHGQGCGKPASRRRERHATDNGPGPGMRRRGLINRAELLILIHAFRKAILTVHAPLEMSN